MDITQKTYDDRLPTVEVFRLEKIPNPSISVTMARAIINWRRGQFVNKKNCVSNEALLKFVRDNDLTTFISTATYWSQHGGVLRRNHAAIAYYILSRVSDDARDWLEKLVYGQEFEPDCPERVLYNTLLKYSLGQKDLTSWEIIARIIKAWNIRRAGQPTPEIITWNPAFEPFPVAL